MEPNNVYMLVLDTLSRASNQDLEIVKPAEKQLQQWEIEPGYYSVLLSIFSDHSIDINVRWLASVTFKNAVDKYWRKNAPNAISEVEKLKLRQGLLSPSIFNEPYSRISIQLAVLISKIARFDCPSQWPELVPMIITTIEKGSAIEQHRALLIFQHVVKSLTTKKLIYDKRIFHELTATVFSFILSIWNDFTQKFLQQIQENASNPVITENLEKALYSLKILKNLMLHGFTKPHENQSAMFFLNAIFDRTKTSLECKKLLKGRGIYILELCEKFIIHLTKVALGAINYYPLSYVSMIAPSLEFSLFYCFTEQGMHLAFERFTIQCLNLLKMILLCEEYKTKDLSQLGESETVRACDIKLSILTKETVCHMCRMLVTHYFLLTSDDLSLWDADAESFATDLNGTWKCNLKPCVESLFLTLFYEFKNILIPEVLTLLKIVREETIDPNNLTMILRKDAVYNVVGLIAPDLYEEVDFDEWFTSQLIREIAIKENNYRIIRRRTATLIGTWSREKVSPELKPLLYRSLLDLLSENEDMAVRLAACNALNLSLDDFNFNTQQFSPFIQPVFNLLLNLLREVEECDTKMHILMVFSLVVERNGEIVLHHTNELLSYLPLLWEEATPHDMLKCSIVSNLVQLVKVLGYWVTPEMEELVFGVLSEATERERPAYIYLLEDGLELWQTVLEVTPADALPTHAETFLRLASNLPNLLEDSMENLQLLICIAHAYLLLMPVEFLESSGCEFMRILTELLNDIQVDGMVKIYKLAEVCLKVTIPEQKETLRIQAMWPMITKIIAETTHREEFSSLIPLRFSLISRLLLHSLPIFLEAIKEVSSNVKADPVTLLSTLLSELSEQLSLIIQVDRRKLIGLGLGVLLTSQISCVIERFPILILCITNILKDVMVTESNGEYTDLILQDPPSPSDSVNDYCYTDSISESQHEGRLKHLTAMDIVHNVDIKSFITNQLMKLQEQVGKEVFQKLIESVPESTLNDLNCYIPIRGG